jgi:hypothetical protein
MTRDRLESLAHIASASASSAGQQLPADLAAHLDLWSTLNFSNVDDGFGLDVGAGTQPFSLGGDAPGTLDDLVRLGEEELQVSVLLVMHILVWQSNTMPAQ